MNLANCGLTLVSLYSFVNLTTLVLKNNMLTSIEKCGVPPIIGFDMVVTPLIRYLFSLRSCKC